MGNIPNPKSSKSSKLHSIDFYPSNHFRQISAIMSNNQASTGQSYLDKATGAIQSGIGSLTGNTADKAQGENRKAEAEVEKDLSHTAAKAGPFSMTAEGGVAKDNQDRTDGSWNQNMGAAKEAL